LGFESALTKNQTHLFYNSFIEAKQIGPTFQLAALINILDKGLQNEDNKSCLPML
jgi:hypothetical protein